MKRLHIIGRKNHGKTTLVVDLVHELTRRGWIVGTIKHTHHHHELDTPGKDSHRHRVAGSARVGILSPSMSACFWPAKDDDEASRYDVFELMYADCDLVLVEGDTQASADKIEVFRAAVGSEPLAKQDASIGAVISDDPASVTAPMLARQELAPIADWICQRLGLSSRPDASSR